MKKTHAETLKNQSMYTEATPENYEDNISASPEKENNENEFDEFDDDLLEEEGKKGEEVFDPIEPFNRAMFQFNDKVYYWIFAPAMQGYTFVVPEAGRLGIRRFFSNITTPIRFVNSLLQLKFKAAGIELGRFVINSTVGLAGFMDPANKMKLYKQDKDLGQTLGQYGAGYGFYINLPFLGPSTFRDLIGTIGDLFLDPVMLLLPVNTAEKVGITAYRKVNEISLTPTLYDDIVKKAFDPYTFMKSAYIQIRESQISRNE